MPDVSTLRLGKTEAEFDPRTVLMASYLTPRAAPPLASHWGHGITFDMDGNDQYGDCVEAEYLHQQKLWCTRTNKSFALTAGAALDSYSGITGFNSNVPSSDKGTSMLAACRYWVNEGMAGYSISAYMSVNPQAQVQVQESVSLFGGLALGLALPLSAQVQTGHTWEVVPGPGTAPGSWGGHCVLACGYSPTMVYVVTWGTIQAMTWDFLATYSDEAYVMLSQDWMAASGISPSGFAWAKLQADLAQF